MIPEIGQFALIIALLLALTQATLPLIGASRGNRPWIALAAPAGQAQFIFVTIAFCCLGYSFITNDFSVLNVATNSNSQLPLHYRLAATWGSHEGSLLLWTFMLALWTVAVSLFSRHLPEEMGRLRRAAAQAMAGAQRAAALTQRLLAFARRQPLDPKPVDVNVLVRGMSELLRRALGETVEVETVLSGGLWRTEADPNELESALLNLAVNARDAMPSGGKLTIETSNGHLSEDYAARHAEVTPGQYVLISVSDTGAGMDKETMSRVFEPFFTTKGEGKGTGLGLSQVYGFVKQSHGHVELYSEPGQGTTVKVYLPRLTGDVAEANAALDQIVPEAATGEVILVVEDDADVRAYSVAALRELGYAVVEASDGPSALALLDERPVHLLFTDVVLPGGMSGADVARGARERHPGIKVLFTSGYSRNAIVHHGRLDPGVQLLTKPFTFESLANKVRDVLDQRG